MAQRADPEDKGEDQTRGSRISLAGGEVAAQEDGERRVNREGVILLSRREGEEEEDEADPDEGKESHFALSADGPVACDERRR